MMAKEDDRWMDPLLNELAVELGGVPDSLGSPASAPALLQSLNHQQLVGTGLQHGQQLVFQPAFGHGAAAAAAAAAAGPSAGAALLWPAASHSPSSSSGGQHPDAHADASDLANRRKKPPQAGARKKTVFCDCLDCGQQPASTDIASSPSPLNEAAARQEPPPKCLLVVLSGTLLPLEGGTQPGTRTLLDACDVPHLHRAAAEGAVCVLTQRASSPADCCAELAQLLNTFDEWRQATPITSLADRFKGLQAAFASNSAAAKQLAAAAGMACSAVLQPDPTSIAGTAPKAACNLGIFAPDAQQLLPDPPEAARRLLAELGLQEADAGIDMLLLHLDVDANLQQQTPPEQQQATPAARASAARSLLFWMDRTLRFLNNSSSFRDTVLLAVIASPGTGSLLEPLPLLQQQASGAPDRVLKQAAAMNGSSSQGSTIARPLQSWQQLAGEALGVCLLRPMLCLRRLPGIIRRDACSRFSLAGASSLPLLADRLIPEVAYKLGKYGKYGA